MGKQDLPKAYHNKRATPAIYVPKLITVIPCFLDQQVPLTAPPQRPSKIYIVRVLQPTLFVGNHFQLLLFAHNPSVGKNNR